MNMTTLFSPVKRKALGSYIYPSYLFIRQKIYWIDN